MAENLARSTLAVAASSDAAPPEKLAPRRALQSRKLSEKRSRLARSFGKRPEELERANSKVIVSLVVLPGQAEADEAEGPALGSS